MSARYALFGYPIAHSLSPALHTAGFRALGVDATYELIEHGTPQFAKDLDALVDSGLMGGNVTAPLKRFVYEMVLEETTLEAQAAGAVNTLRVESGGIVGHNTDGVGFVRFLERAGSTVAGRSFAFLGGGGAAAGLSRAVRFAGAGEISIIARDPERAAHHVSMHPELGMQALWWGSPKARHAIETADIVVQATPLGGSSEDPLPCRPEWVAAHALAVDLLYHPAETPWLAALRARAVRAANGIGLLIEQALLAQAFWFEDEPPRSALEEAVPWSDPFTPPGLPGGGPSSR